MKTLTRRAAFILVITLLFALTIPALAQFGESPDDFTFFPASDITLYISPSGTGGDNGLTSDGMVQIGDPTAWIKATVNADGTTLIERNKDTTPTAMGWPDITAEASNPDNIGLLNFPTTTYYVHYSFTAYSQWNFSIVLDDAFSVSFTRKFTNDAKMPALEGPAFDGNPGTYEGTFNLNDFLKNDSANYLNDGLTTPIDVTIAADFNKMKLFVVDPGSAKGGVLVNYFYIDDKATSNLPTIKPPATTPAGGGGGGTNTTPAGGGGGTTNTTAPAGGGGGSPTTADPGLAAIIMTGLTGLAGTGILLKKRK